VSDKSEGKTEVSSYGQSGGITAGRVDIHQELPRAASTIEQVRVVGTREIPSPHQDAPYGLEILFQTTVPLSPITLNIECAAPVQYVEVMPSQDFTGTVAWGGRPVPGAPNIAAVTMTQPAFLPEHAMAVRIFSKTRNQYRNFRYQAGHPR